MINRSISNALKAKVDRKLINRKNAKKNDRRHSQGKNLWGWDNKYVQKHDWERSRNSKLSTDYEEYRK